RRGLPTTCGAENAQVPREDALALRGHMHTQVLETLGKPQSEVALDLKHLGRLFRVERKHRAIGLGPPARGNDGAFFKTLSDDLDLSAPVVPGHEQPAFNRGHDHWSCVSAKAIRLGERPPDDSAQIDASVY